MTKTPMNYTFYFDYNGQGSKFTTLAYSIHDAKENFRLHLMFAIAPVDNPFAEIRLYKLTVLESQSNKPITN
jgi:hypothetical protein